MEVTQDIILKYLKQNHLGLSKSSTKEEIYMLEFLLDKGLMTPIGAGGATINNDGNAFINSANYFDPVPLTKFDWMGNIINQLNDGDGSVHGYGSLFDKAINELKQDGIIEQAGNTCYKTLTTKGRQYLNSGLSYNAFLSNGMKPYSVIKINSHEFNAPASQLDLSNRSNTNDTQNFTNTTAEAVKTKKSIQRIIIEAVFILAAIAAIIEVLHIYHVTINF